MPQTIQIAQVRLWIGLCSVLRPHQHSIGYMGDGFYRSKDPTNSIKVLKENLLKQITQRTKKTQITHAYTQNGKTNTAYNYNTASPLVYNNTGWLGDSSHRGQGCQAWTVVGLPPRYPPRKSDWHSRCLQWTTALHRLLTNNADMVKICKVFYW